MTVAKAVAYVRRTLRSEQKRRGLSERWYVKACKAAGIRP